MKKKFHETKTNDPTSIHYIAPEQSYQTRETKTNYSHYRGDTRQINTRTNDSFVQEFIQNS